MRLIPRGCESFLLRPKLTESDSLRVLTGSANQATRKFKSKGRVPKKLLIENDPIQLSPESPGSLGSDGTVTTCVSTSESEMEDFIEKNRTSHRVHDDAEDSVCNASADTRWASNHKKGKKKKTKPKPYLNNLGDEDIKSSDGNGKKGLSIDLAQRGSPHLAMPSHSMAQYACIPSFCLDLPDASTRISSSHEAIAQQLWGSMQVNNGFQIQQLLQEGLDTKRHHGDGGISLLFFGPPPTIDQLLFPNMCSHDVKIYCLVERWIIHIPNSFSEDPSSDTKDDECPLYMHRQFLSDFETIVNSNVVSDDNREHNLDTNHELKFKLAHHHAMSLLQTYGNADLALATLREFLLPQLIKAIVNRGKNQLSGPTVWRLDALIRFTRRNIAILHMLQGDFISARDNLWQITRCRSNDLVAHVFLGMSLCAIGNFEDAIRIYLKTLVLLQRQPELDVIPSRDKEGKAMPICSKLRRNKHKFAVGKVLNNMGYAFFQGSDYFKAKQTFERALRILCSKEFDSLDLTVYAKQMESSADKTEDDSDFEETKQSQKTGFDSYLVYNENYIPSAFGQDVTITFCNLAHTYIKLQNLNGAIFTLGTALKVQQNLPEKDITLIFMILSCLGYLCTKVGEHRKALHTYAQLFMILDEDTQTNSSDIEKKKVHALSHMSFIYLTLKDYANCLTTLSRLLTHQESLYNPDHPDIAKTKKSIEKLEVIVSKTQAAVRVEL